jgi:hypothetical protein
MILITQKQNQHSHKRMEYASVSIKTILQEFYQITFRKKLYSTLAELQAALDVWQNSIILNELIRRKMCSGHTPLETLFEGKRIWAEKNLAQI